MGLPTAPGPATASPVLPLGVRGAHGRDRRAALMSSATPTCHAAVPTSRRTTAPSMAPAGNGRPSQPLRHCAASHPGFPTPAAPATPFTADATLREKDRSASHTARHPTAMAHRPTTAGDAARQSNPAPAALGESAPDGGLDETLRDSGNRQVPGIHSRAVLRRADLSRTAPAAPLTALPVGPPLRGRNRSASHTSLRATASTASGLAVAMRHGARRRGGGRR